MQRPPHLYHERQTGLDVKYPFVSLELFAKYISEKDDGSLESEGQFLTVGLHVPVHPVQPALAGEVRHWRGGVDGIVNSWLSYTL